MQIVGFWRSFYSKYIETRKKKTIWEDVLKLWICFIKTRNSVNVIKSNFHTFPIRYNSEIEANNNTIFIKCWYQNGVETVIDNLQDGGLDALAQKFHYPHLCGIVCAISTL